MYPSVIQYETRLRDLERELQQLTSNFGEIVSHDRKGLGRRVWALIRRGTPKASPATHRS